jgi:hypothetical protein
MVESLTTLILICIRRDLFTTNIYQNEKNSFFLDIFWEYLLPVINSISIQLRSLFSSGNKPRTAFCTDRSVARKCEVNARIGNGISNVSTVIFFWMRK